MISNNFTTPPSASSSAIATSSAPEVTFQSFSEGVKTAREVAPMVMTQADSSQSSTQMAGGIQHGSADLTLSASASSSANEAESKALARQASANIAVAESFS